MTKLNCILLVDDDDITNFVHELLIEEADAAEQVVITKNGREALDALDQRESASSQSPYLVLLDINMPIMNGFEFLDAYQKLTKDVKQSVVVVVLTTSLNPKDAERVRNSQANDFVHKPLDRAKLKGILDRHFTNSN